MQTKRDIMKSETFVSKMKGIPESKKSKHIWIVLLQDLGDYALYFNKTDNCFAGFEVHKIRVREATECNIKQKDGTIRHFTVPKRRVIASSREFGRYAWHYPNLDLVFENHPQFEKYNHEIETRLKEATVTVAERVLRDRGNKTTTASSKSLGSKLLLDVITENGTRDDIVQNGGFFNFRRRV